MAFSASLLMALVLIFSRPMTSISWDLPQSFDLGKQETFTALNRMGTISLSCPKYRTDIKFPSDALEGGGWREARAGAVVQELLRQVFQLLHTERAAAAWSPALLDRLRGGLHRQLEALDACLPRAPGDEEPAPGVDGPGLAVRRYFREIRDYLQEKGYSDCAWEVVTVEIRSRFPFINRLIRKLGN